MKVQVMISESAKSDPKIASLQDKLTELKKEQIDLLKEEAKISKNLIQVKEKISKIERSLEIYVAKQTPPKLPALNRKYLLQTYISKAGVRKGWTPGYPVKIISIKNDVILCRAESGPVSKRDVQVKVSDIGVKYRFAKG